MKAIRTYGRSYFEGLAGTWDRFWFTPSAPQTLALMRIATGLMLLYTHVIWASELAGFLGPEPWIDHNALSLIHEGQAKWSYLSLIDNMGLLWAHQIFTLIVMACFTLGCGTRIVAPLAWLLQLMFVHRLTGALFGLDQMTTMLVMYLMLSRCGSVWSVDSWLRKRGARHRLVPDSSEAISNTIATRLIQLHLCVIYLFGGVGKMRGDMWWDGHAVWYAVSSYEYQSMDMTWMVHYPMLFSALSCITIFWETFYCALVWPRLTRPIVIAIAVGVHGGIALFLGMITFGVIMIVANLSFVSPCWFSKSCKLSEDS